MRVLTVISRAFQVWGGAAITNWTLLKRMQREFGFECGMAARHPVERDERRGSVRVTAYRDLEELRSRVLDFRPDVMIGALDGLTDAAGVAQFFNIPLIAYFQSYEYCEPSTEEKQAWGLSPTWRYPSREEVDLVIRAADRLFACSQYLADVFEGRYRRNVEGLYPEFAPDDFMLSAAQERQPGYITGICGHRYKGADILLQLAATFPNERFLLVGDADVAYQPRFRGQTNITLLGYADQKEFLSRSKIVLVPSQWPEGFGRIAVEAMANGIPTLVSWVGGLAEIVGEAPMGVRSFGDAGAWADQLRALLDSDDRYQQYASQGPQLVRRFLEGDSTRRLANVCQSLVEQKTARFERPVAITLYGDKTHQTAYSLVNAWWWKHLDGLGYDMLERQQVLSVQDIVLHHDCEQRFVEFSPPETGKYVAVRTWDFGRFPRVWVEKINAECDQLWVHCRFTAEQAVASGVDPARVRVVPLGIDAQIFKPQGDIYSLSSAKRFKFVFAGATVLRKGIDTLLDAYTQAFSPQDNVCLVIKDHTKDVFYSQISYKAKIIELAEAEDVPEIIYIDDYLPREQIGSLYRACNVGVFPYRAEGFCLPILEAMACGTPSIVPSFGPALDFCDDQTSYLMPIKRINVPVGKRMSMNTLGFEEEVDEVDFCEVRVDTLVDFMQRAYNASGEELERKALAGVRVASRQFTWHDSVAEIEQNISGLIGSEVPHRFRQQRLDTERAYKTFEIASELLLEARGGTDGTVR